jgi:hypothetical protein
MIRTLFHRSLNRFSGGHLKVWDYFNHVLQSPRHAPRVYFAPGSLWDENNPWRKSRDHTTSEWDVAAADVLFLAGRDWRMLSGSQRREPPVPVVNLIQHVRHAAPDDPRRRFLTHRAVRICVSQETAEAISGTGLVNGPVFVIPNGIDLAALPTAAHPDERPHDIVIAGLKAPQLADRIRRELEPTGKKIVSLTTQIPRADFLANLAAARIAVLLPNAAEGFYLPAIEAMALGTLVVCPDCVGNRSFCVPDENCLRPAHDEPAIVLAARAALALPAAKTTAMLAAARETAERHSIHAERAAFLAVLNDLEQIW